MHDEFVSELATIILRYCSWKSAWEQNVRFNIIYIMRSTNAALAAAFQVLPVAPIPPPSDPYQLLLIRLASFGRTHDMGPQHHPGVAWNRSLSHPPKPWRHCAACMSARRVAGAPTRCRIMRRSLSDYCLTGNWSPSRPRGAAGDSIPRTAR